jgi:serine/threonine protein kinase
MAMTEPLALNGPTDPLAGTPYRARLDLAPVGSGAMGDVIEAEHRTLGKRVLVKLVRPEHADSDAMDDRMRLEAQAAVALSGHPNIVEVFDFGHTGEGRCYLAMERLVGRTLKQEVTARGPLPVHEAIGVVKQVLHGLGAAHEAGLVHRDIKPENLFLCDPGPDGARRVKILDFGIVKVVRNDGRAPRPLAIPTAEGMAIGTPRFLSPEQALGRPVDARTDLYALGCVLFWLVAGRDPFFDKDGLFAIVKAHAAEVPPPLSAVAQQPISRALDELVAWALEKSPDHRFASAQQMLAALELLEERPARPARWARTEPLDTRALRLVGAPPLPPRPLPAPPPLDEDEVATAPALHPARASPSPPRALPAPARRPSPLHRHVGAVIAGAVFILVALTVVLLYTSAEGVPW